MQIENIKDSLVNALVVEGLNLSDAVDAATLNLYYLDDEEISNLKNEGEIQKYASDIVSEMKKEAEIGN